ncbi:type IV pilus biogenesis protein PilM [Halalkalibacter kiskunsagensis]|uniref:Type IV pilus biogenesis protein PilM n=1 Tax=Halalkalibacter kiskunsagensis TaxID=1548599 RepID=A0ABV6K7Y5_9BACI
MLPCDDPVFDYKVLGLHEGQKEVLLFASREKVVHGYVELLEEVKLKPNAADLSSLSAYRLFHDLKLTNEVDYTMLIQIDTTSTNLTIFHQHHPVFSRTIPSELDQESWDIARDYAKSSLVWKDDEEILFTYIDDQVREIEKVMNFYQFNVLQGIGVVSQLLVCGDHPYVASFVRSFKQAFSAKHQQLIVTEGNDYERLEQAVQLVERQVVPASLLLDYLVTLLPERGHYLNFDYALPGIVSFDASFDRMEEIAAYHHELEQSNVVSAVTLSIVNTNELEIASDDVLPRYVASFSLEIKKSEVRKLGDCK